jgi:hypothetical protein
LWSSRTPLASTTASRTNNTAETWGINGGAWLYPVRRAHDAEAAIATQAEKRGPVSKLDDGASQLHDQDELRRILGQIWTTPSRAAAGASPGCHTVGDPTFCCAPNGHLSAVPHSSAARQPHVRFLRDSALGFRESVPEAPKTLEIDLRSPDEAARRMQMIVVNDLITTKT